VLGGADSTEGKQGVAGLAGCGGLLAEGSTVRAGGSCCHSGCELMGRHGLAVRLLQATEY